MIIFLIFRRCRMEKSFRHGLIRRKSRTKICHDHRSVNEQQVEDITLDLFYKPHTLSLLAFLLERIYSRS